MFKKTLLALFAGMVGLQVQAKDKTKITILQTADIHAYLNTHNELFVENGELQFRKAGGIANIKTLVNKIKKENPEGTLLVDGGDLIQGSGESVLSEGAIFPPLIEDMQYDLLIPGNWEVIYGKKVMMDVMQNYNSNVIVSNMFHEEGNQPLFPPYWVTEKKGVKIGFIAYNDPEVPVRQNPMFSEGIAFAQVEENLKDLVHELKVEQEVDLLFLVAHIGISKQIMLANNPAIKGVDFVLGNDTHERVRQPIKGKYAMVVEPGSFGSFLGRLDIYVKNGKMDSYEYELIEVDPNKYPADPVLQAKVDSVRAPYEEKLSEVLGYTTAPLYRYLVVENAMDNMITDALLEKSGADIAISNGFRFGVPILPDPETGKAAITVEDLWRMLPVDENMKIGEVTGEQIKNWLEKEINNAFSPVPSERFGGWLIRFAGMTMKFDTSRPYGERVLEVKVKGEDLDLNKTYRMASCNRTGEAIHVLCRMPHAKNVKIMDYTLHEAVKDYLKEKGTVHPQIEGRAKAVNLGEQVFSSLENVGYIFQ